MILTLHSSLVPFENHLTPYHLQIVKLSQHPSLAISQSKHWLFKIGILLSQVGAPTAKVSCSKQIHHEYIGTAYADGEIPSQRDAPVTSTSIKHEEVSFRGLTGL